MDKMNYTKGVKKEFKNTFKKIINSIPNSENEIIDEAAFPAYAHTNIFIDTLFWGRLRYVEKMIQQISYNKETPLRILDFGCGSGIMSYILAKYEHQVIVTDINSLPFEYMQKYISFPQSIEMISNESLNLEMYTDYFDIVIALDVLEHVDNLESILELFEKVVKSDGSIIVSGPTENILYRVGRNIAGKRFTGHYHKSNIDDIEDVCALTMKIKKIATLYPVFPLFKIFSATPKDI